MQGSLLLAIFASQALGLLLPSLLGPNLVGTIRLELVDYKRNDPLAPTPQPRDLMVSVFYPVQHIRRYPLANDFTTLYAEFLDARLSLSPGVAESIVSQAHASAYLHPNTNSQPKVLIFSPNYQGSRVEFTSTLSSMASLGYIVIGVDHPYDTSFIDYPDGRIVMATQAAPSSDEQAAALVDIRVADVQFVLDSLSNNSTWAKQIPGVHGTLDVSKAGVWGHALGGATAASAVLADERFACGFDVDGSLEVPVISAGLDRPFMLFGSEGHNRTSDPSWAEFWGNLKGWKLEVSVNGSTQPSFADSAYIYEKLRGNGVPDFGDIFGTISGTRALFILTNYLGAFFEMCFTHKKEVLLEGPSTQFSEVIF